MTEYKVYAYDIVFVYNVERVYTRMTQWNRRLLSSIYNRRVRTQQFRMQ